VDFTGGIGYRVDLTKRRELPQDMFAQLQALDRMSTLMGCSIYVSDYTVYSARMSAVF